MQEIRYTDAVRVNHFVQQCRKRKRQRKPSHYVGLNVGAQLSLRYENQTNQYYNQ